MKNLINQEKIKKEKKEKNNLFFFINLINKLKIL